MPGMPTATWPSMDTPRSAGPTGVGTVCTVTNGSQQHWSGTSTLNELVPVNAMISSGSSTAPTTGDWGKYTAMALERASVGWIACGTHVADPGYFW